MEIKQKKELRLTIRNCDPIVYKDFMKYLNKFLPGRDTISSAAESLIKEALNQKKDKGFK